MAPVSSSFGLFPTHESAHPLRRGAQELPPLAGLPERGGPRG
jgi:hypothetical protein